MVTRRQFPRPDTPLTQQVWNADDLRATSTWRIAVPPPVLDEFAAFGEGTVLDAEFAKSGDLARLPLPRLRDFAARLRAELTVGTGVAWVTSGLSAPSGEALRRLFFAALGNAIGWPLETYGRLYEVRDTGRSHRDEPIPISQTRAETSFHTDSSARDVLPDVVGLLCLQPAMAGGDTLISSATAVHERLRSVRPHDLDLLYREFVRDVITPGADRLALCENRFPVFCLDRGSGPLFRYMRYWIETGCQRAGMSLTPTELSAFDRLDAMLGSQEHAVRLRLDAGAMLWLNNWTIAHNRTEFRDDPASPRRLLRMWLTLPPPAPRP
jgi:hypothetical protein